MNKKEIKKNIDDATRIFRETLEKTYLENDKEFHGIGIHKFMTFFTGKVSHQRLSNGNLKICGEIGKKLLDEKCKGLPRKYDDFQIYPLVITLFNKEIKK